MKTNTPLLAKNIMEHFDVNTEEEFYNFTEEFEEFEEDSPAINFLDEDEEFAEFADEDDDVNNFLGFKRKMKPESPKSFSGKRGRRNNRMKQLSEAEAIAARSKQIKMIKALEKSGKLKPQESLRLLDRIDALYGDIETSNFDGDEYSNFYNKERRELRRKLRSEGKTPKEARLEARKSVPAAQVSLGLKDKLLSLKDRFLNSNPSTPAFDTKDENKDVAPPSAPPHRI